MKFQFNISFVTYKSIHLACRQLLRTDDETIRPTLDQKNESAVFRRIPEKGQRHLNRQVRLTKIRPVKF